MCKFFLEVEIGIIGCNFVIVDSGLINLNINEGNVDLIISIFKI